MEYEESLMCKTLPGMFLHRHYKILDCSWFHGNTIIVAVLVYNMKNNNIESIIGGPYCFGTLDEDEFIQNVVDYRSLLPSAITRCIFRKYFSKPEVMKHLDKEFRVYIGILNLLDEK